MWTIILLQRSPDFLPWLWPLIALGLVVGAGGLIVAWAMRRQRSRLVAGALSVALLAVLAGPAAYAAAALGTPVSTTFPSAGPATTSLSSRAPGGGPMMRRGGFRRSPGGGGRGPGAPFGKGAPARTTTNTAALDRYLVQHRGSATWIVAVVGSMVAAPIILDTGRPVMAMGGYNGNDPTPTAGELRVYVAGGELKYVLLTTGSMFGPPGVIPWVTSHCMAVDVSAYGGTSGGNDTLYACGSR